MKVPGEVAVFTKTADLINWPAAIRTTSQEQDFPGVYQMWGNGSSASIVIAGKALVRIKTGLVVHPGDTLVSAGSGCPTETVQVWNGSFYENITVTIGCADVNNSVTDSRKILGYALENANFNETSDPGETKDGFVAIIMPNR